MVSSPDIAIIGMSCRLPGAGDVDAFWRLLAEGRSAITEVPRERWSHQDLYDPDPQAPGKANTRWGGFIDGADQFDPAFFAMSPEEAVSVDPQQRLMLELAWEALEHAAIDPHGLKRSGTGVYVGISHNDYERITCRDRSRITRNHGTGAYQSMAANRLSYFLDVVGPSMTLDTACSSGLVALHVACQNLRSGEVPLAIVGTVTLHLTPEETIGLAKGGLLSPDGQCRSFDAGANGYVRGEGGVALVLRRLDEALADGDRVCAVIRGSAVNHNGRSNGLSAPNSLALQAVMTQALASSGVAPSDVGFVETHGTGTPLGDQLELKALREVYGEPAAQGPCWLGCLKTNMGHLETTSGLAATLKAVLALQRGAIPPNLNFERPPANVPLSATRLAFPTRLESWPAGSPARVAAVTAYGFGGANGHVLLQAAPPAPPRPARQSPGAGLLCVSAPTAESLRQLLQRHADHLEGTADTLPDICGTAASGRATFPHRAAFVARSTADLASQIRAELASTAPTGAVPRRFSVACVVGDGVGSAPRDAHRTWWQRQPSYQSAWAECQQALPAQDLLAGHEAALSSFSHAYASARWWAGLGVKPAAFAGSGRGLLVAATLAGRVRLDQALALLCGHGPVTESAGRTPIFDTRTGDAVAAGAIDWAECLSRTPAPLHHAPLPAHDVILHIGDETDPAGDDDSPWQPLKQLFLAGAKLPWARIHEGRSLKRVDLPSTPFDRTRCWFDTAAPTEPPAVLEQPAPASTPRQATSPSAARRTGAPAALPPHPTVSDLRRWLAAWIADVLAVPADEVDTEAAFSDFGIDSAQAVDMAREMSERLGLPVDPTVLWSHPNIDALARHMVALRPTPAVSSKPASSSSSSTTSSLLEQLRQELRSP